MTNIRIEVTANSRAGDPGIAAAAHRLGVGSLRSCRKTLLYFLASRSGKAPNTKQIESSVPFFLSIR